MDVIVCKNYEEVSSKAASYVIKEMIVDPEMIIGLATGSSPIGLYKNLVDAYEKDIISFKDIKTFNLDEYVGISRDHPESYYSFMYQHLFKHVDIKSDNINIPDNDLNRIDSLPEEYNSLLDGNQRDIQLLGIGSNGHIGFNEPGTTLSNETFVIELSEQTRKDNSRFFGTIEEVPKFAITMGIKNIMYANKILMIATGLNKADAVEQMINGDITIHLPASILQLHPKMTLIIDEAAASKLDLTSNKLNFRLIK